MTSRNNGYRWVMLLGVWLLYFSFGLAVTSIAPLVEPIRSDLDISYTAIGVILGIWQFVYIGSAIPCGMLLDKLGPNLALIIGGIIITISMFFRAVAPDFAAMVMAVMLFRWVVPLSLQARQSWWRACSRDLRGDSQWAFI